MRIPRRPSVLPTGASALAAAISRGERWALSKAVTLVESERSRSRASAQLLLTLLLPHRDAHRTLRLGISGAPGSGKSTLIESLGSELCRRQHKLTVLAVDPSSQRSGGSVLGDKTRMPILSRHPRAFVRPSPARGVLGGVARHTEDVAVLCESAGYDRLIVETVGVGQSEVAVSAMVDIFVLLVPPGAGDGLQGIKRGIMELADLIVVTKADGQLLSAAEAVAQDLRAAVAVLRPRDRAWTPRVLTSSSLDPTTASRLLEAIDEFDLVARESGAKERRRKQQALHSVWEHARSELFERLAMSAEIREQVEELASRANEGKITPSQAGDLVADRMLRSIAPL